MNAIDRINRSLEEWFDSLHTGRSAPHATGMQPKDVLRHILSALEENRVEGLDNKQYAPNAYEVELYLDDPEEKGRLLPFLSKEEIAAAIGRYCQQHQYTLRGPLEISLSEAARPMQETALATEANGTRTAAPREKVHVRCRYDVSPAEEAAFESRSDTQPVYTQTQAAERAAEIRQEETHAVPWQNRR